MKTYASEISETMELLKRTKTHSQGLSQVITCRGCAKASRDDGSWNKRTIPHRKTEFVCHVCFAGTRRPWREEFLLSEKARFGTVHTPRGYPTTDLDVMHIRERLQREVRKRSSRTGVTYLKTLLPYVYFPLSHGQIRVLDLLPGKGDSDLCCTVKHIDLKAAEVSKYEALSYCWEGADEEKMTIWIEDCAFGVPQSLFVALNCVRDPWISRTF